MRHVALLTELESQEPDSPAWHALAGIYICVRALDRWIEGAPRDEVVGACAAARDHLQRDACEGGIVHPALRAIDELAAATAFPNSADRVFAPLLACADQLSDRGTWAAAVDVCSTLLSAGAVSVRPCVQWRAFRLRGYLNWTSGNLNAADEDYAAALAAARKCGSAEGVARARHGTAKVLMHRGNLPGAEAAYRTLLASEPEIPARMRAMVYHDLAAVLWRRQCHSEAIAALQAAVRGLDGQDRERAVGDLGNVFFESGAWSIADQIYALVIARARDPVARSMARINRLEIMAKVGDRVAFEQQLAALDGVELPRWLQIERLRTLSACYASLGDTALATQTLTALVSMAEKEGFYEHLIHGERLADQVRRASDAARPPVPVFIESQSHGEVVRFVNESLPAF